MTLSQAASTGFCGAVTVTQAGLPRASLQRSSVARQPRIGPKMAPKLPQKPPTPPEAKPNRFRLNPPMAKADPSSTEACSVHLVAFNRASHCPTSQKPFSKTFAHPRRLASRHKRCTTSIALSQRFASHYTAHPSGALPSRKFLLPVTCTSSPRPAPARAMLRGG
ncbi:hypothetical protein PWT90_09868 [Aphanocladium album]|nr:hypothetical protein PWT90_09868 [Aphanocladium album]